MCDTTRISGVDEQGVKYNDYPECPSGDPKCHGRVGRNHIGRTGDPAKDMHVDDWYCYECGTTF